MCGAIDQPSTRREQMSITNAILWNL
jgi:hypothetical protein